MLAWFLILPACVYYCVSRLCQNYLFTHNKYSLSVSKNEYLYRSFKFFVRKNVFINETVVNILISKSVFRWMFWSDWGKEAKIERAGLDGSHRQTIVSYDIKWPNGLTLDLVRRRVYWVDAKLNLISSCDYDGAGRRQILRSPDTLHHPFSISVFEDFVYWTDWDKQAIFRANKFNGTNVTPITALHMVNLLLPIICYFLPETNYLSLERLVHETIK